MNYETTNINSNTYNDTEFYTKNIHKTETNLHTKTKETMRKSDENLSKYYKPKPTHVKSFSDVSIFPQSHSRSSSSLVDSKISTFESAFSLQKSTFKYTIPKSIRFTDKPILTDALYNLRTEPDKRATYIGYGSKLELAQKELKNVPSPNDYTIRSIFEKNMAYKKGYVMGVKTNQSQMSNVKNPGPGAYNINILHELKYKYPVAMRSRLKFFYDEDLQKQKHCVSPQKYFPNLKLVQQNRYHEVGIGSGKRTKSELTGALINPGPGAHNLPSIFDKTLRTKVPLN